jgi:hypothetical protein
MRTEGGPQRAPFVAFGDTSSKGGRVANRLSYGATVQPSVGLIQITGTPASGGAA